MKRTAERGFTLIEIMIVVAIIALLAAIAIPNVLRARTSANETAAVGNMRALVSSMEMYRSVNSQYPATWLADMYTTPNPDFGPAPFGSAPAISLQGYIYHYNPVSTQTYKWEAGPVTVGRTGTRGFFVDEGGQIHHCTATTDDTTASATAGVTTAVADAGNNTLDGALVNCA